MQFIKWSPMLVLLVLMGVGCQSLLHPPSSTSCGIRMVNLRNTPIRSVAIRQDGRAFTFGYLSGPGGGKTISEFMVDFSSEVAVEWDEDSQERRAVVSVSCYRRKTSAIGALTFYYEGDGLWRVVAQSGASVSSPVVPPEPLGVE